MWESALIITIPLHVGLVKLTENYIAGLMDEISLKVNGLLIYGPLSEHFFPRHTTPWRIMYHKLL